MTGPIVNIDTYELLDAAIAGVRRHIHQVFRPNAHGLPEIDDWNVDLTGAVGELVVAKYFNRYWRPVVRDPWNDIRCDIGTSLQIKTTEHDNGHLIVHKHHPDDCVYILVVGRNLTWRIAGWLMGWEAKQDTWWNTNHRVPAFWVPQKELRPIEKLAIA